MEEKSKIIKKIVLSFAIDLLILIILGIVSLSWLIPQIKKEALSLREKQTEIAIFQGQENSRADLEKNYQEIKPNLTQIITALPSKSDLTKFVNDLDKIASSSFLRFEEKSPIPGTLLFEVKNPGNLESGVILIKNLETLPYLIKIQSFEITPSSSNLKAVLWISK